MHQVKFNTRGGVAEDKVRGVVAGRRESSRCAYTYGRTAGGSRRRCLFVSPDFLFTFEERFGSDLHADPRRVLRDSSQHTADSTSAPHTSQVTAGLRRELAITDGRGHARHKQIPYSISIRPAVAAARHRERAQSNSKLGCEFRSQTSKTTVKNPLERILSDSVAVLCSCTVQ